MRFTNAHTTDAPVQLYSYLKYYTGRAVASLKESKYKHSFIDFMAGWGIKSAKKPFIERLLFK